MPVAGNNLNPQYSLSIRLYADGFSFFAYTAQSNDYLLHEDYPLKTDISYAENLKLALQHTRLLQYEYAEIHAVSCIHVTSVPLECFKKEETELLYKLVFPDTNKENIHYAILPRLEIVQLFAVNREVEALLCSQFPNISFTAFSVSLLEWYHVFNKRSNQKHQMMVYLHRNLMELCVLSEGKILFNNSFDVTSTNDAAYFLLYTWKDCALDSENDELLFIGKNEELEANVRKYIRQVHILHANVAFRRAPLTRQSETPFDLLTLLLKNI